MALIGQMIPGANAPQSVSLDIPERQLLVDYGAGEHHHRILYVHVNAAVWIVGTPTGDTYDEDLADNDGLLSVPRRGPFPAVPGNAFLFEDNITAPQLARIRENALAMAEILGAALPGAPAVAGAEWYFSDPAYEHFGDVIPPASMAQASTVVRASHAMVEVTNSQGAKEWTTGQHLKASDKPEWLAEKREGAGRDPRLLPRPRSLRAGSSSASSQALPSFRECMQNASSAPGKWARFSGDSAAAEVAQSLSSAGVEPNAFCATWETACGAPANSPLVREHRHLIFLFWLAAVQDLVDPTHLASLEHCARRILQIEKAIKRSPKNPDFEGLDPYMKHMTEPTLGISAPKFEAHVADELRGDAAFLKQTRLAREERENLENKRNKKDKKGKDD